ncbi:YegS/Rv2252/BmrU family lipid kinase [Echinicola sediminis]
MNKQYLFVLNPISGEGVNKAEVIETLQNQLYGIELSVWETTGSPDDQTMIRDMIGEKPWDGILVGGGDGTIKLVVEAVQESGLPLGIVPLGSANGMATGLGIHGVSDACYAVQKGRTKTVDLWRINGELCIHLSDFGFNAGVVKKSTNYTSRGMMSYFKGSLAQFVEMKPYNFKVKIDGNEEAVEAKMLVIANGNKYGTGALINPTGKIDDGAVEIVALNPEGLDEMVGLSLALFKGTLAESEMVKIWSVSEAEISNPDGADFQIDGEVMPETKTVKVYRDKYAIDFYCLE